MSPQPIDNLPARSFLYQFEIKGMKGEALKLVWTIAQPHHKQLIDSELVLAPFQRRL
jgi:hypothetical protein